MLRQAVVNMETARTPVRFEASTHSYWCGDRRLPSITAIIRKAGLSPTMAFASPVKGTAVHDITALYDLGETIAGLNPEQSAYLGGWIKAKAFLGITRFDEVEQPRADLEFGFAGTPDRVVKDTVIEIKTGEEKPFHRIQTAGQRVLVGRWIRKRLAVYLKPDGTFRIVNHDERPAMWLPDMNAFLNALGCAAWRIKNEVFWEAD